ncbi:MAG TPA: sugar phosphate nucleotidyltransferase [Flavisolibacter sp.]|jgi:NDP-sugar pyrophosphorylase family protein|nr:sugar phosphate nucleotidyltransferase [Flavisolibacter sp.]
MKAMVFAAGLGTRFKPWTDQHPKALATVNGKTLLQRNLEYLQQYDITDVVVNVHHFADQIEEAIRVNKGWGSNVVISDEREAVLETGGGLLKAREFLKDDSFITLNVDILTEANLKHFLAWHQQENALITLATKERETSRYLLFNKYNRLCGWRNVKTGEEKIVLQAKDLFQKAYSGLAIFEPTVFDEIRQTGKFSLIDLYLSLAHDNKIASFDHSESKFIDVGKPDSVKEAEVLFA